jgi:hypothetical protein
VVVIVGVAVAAFAPVILTGLVDPKLKDGISTAPVGLEEIAAFSVTEPVKPPAGVTVTVAVLPVVAPTAIVAAVPLIEKLGGGRLMV